MDISSFNGTISTISFYVLLALADKSLHAYGVRDEIIHDSSGELILPSGTLYPALRRLSRDGLLERLDDIDRPRYRITPQGRLKLELEAKRLHHVYYHAHLKLGQKIFSSSA